MERPCALVQILVHALNGQSQFKFQYRLFGFMLNILLIKNVATTFLKKTLILQTSEDKITKELENNELKK